MLATIFQNISQVVRKQTGALCRSCPLLPRPLPPCWAHNDRTPGVASIRTVASRSQINQLRPPLPRHQKGQEVPRAHPRKVLTTLPLAESGGISTIQSTTKRAAMVSNGCKLRRGNRKNTPGGAITTPTHSHRLPFRQFGRQLCRCEAGAPLHQRMPRQCRR